MNLFWSFTRQAFHNTAIYRFEFWLQLFSTFFMMYSVYWIWNILYTQSPNAFDVNLEQMITYGILGMALETIFHPSRGPQTYIATQIRSGAIDTDLLKPIDFHLHMFARNFGETLFRLSTLAIPSVLIGFIFLDLGLPNSFLGGILFIISLLLGYIVLFSLNFLIGMLAVVTLDIRSISWSYNAAVRFFAGQMVPLWLFPGIIGTIADILPFKSIYFIPVSIYIGKLDGLTAFEGLSFQAIWALALILLCRLAWTGVHSKLSVQGG